MKIGFVGLGAMGGAMALRLMRGGHEIVGYDRDAEAIDMVARQGAAAASSLEDLVERLSEPRIVWIMVPAGHPVDETIEQLVPKLARDDIIIDGGNSNYKDTLRRAEAIEHHGMHFLDVGTSGGIWGLKEGYSLMVGGEKEVADKLESVFETLAPAKDKGWAYVGPNGAGHFVKMVHNGIEYGMMQAYAEGFEIMRRKEEFQLDLAKIADIWRYGSVVRSWLLDLTARALSENPELSGIAPSVADSGEGRWTVKEAIDLDIPAPVITLALQRRFRSRMEDSFGDKLLAALRHEFGGHSMKRSEGK